MGPPPRPPPRLCLRLRGWASVCPPRGLLRVPPSPFPTGRGRLLVVGRLCASPSAAPGPGSGPASETHTQRAKGSERKSLEPFNRCRETHLIKCIRHPLLLNTRRWRARLGFRPMGSVAVSRDLVPLRGGDARPQPLPERVPEPGAPAPGGGGTAGSVRAAGPGAPFLPCAGRRARHPGGAGLRASCPPVAPNHPSQPASGTGHSPWKGFKRSQRSSWVFKADAR